MNQRPRETSSLAVTLPLSVSQDAVLVIYGTWLRLKASKEFSERATVIVFVLLKVGGKPGIFKIFVYFLAQMQYLRPLSYCAPQLLS